MVIDGTSHLLSQEVENMSAAAEARLATEKCVIFYRLRKCSFLKVVDSLINMKEVESLQHALDCTECQEAILKRTPHLSRYTMERKLALALERVKRMS